jgi:hypothetical protein
MKRDPHLPSPEVCDWLLSLEWEGPASHVIMRDGARIVRDGARTVYDAYIAIPELGADNEINLVLHEEALEALREDAKARAGMEAG